MARIPRVVVPGVPYHVTHRGNRRAAVFFSDDDRQYYLALLAEQAHKHGLEIWSWCLMTNHVHLLVCPRGEDSMARAIGHTHMRYARRINRAHGWCGHLWANRYHSSPLDDEHLWHAARYIELNPVRANMVDRAENYSWSSCSEHAGLSEPLGLLADGRPLPGHITVTAWADWINAPVAPDAFDRLRADTLSGRPCGSDRFVKDMESRLGRLLQKPPMGRPKAGKTPDHLMEDLFARKKFWLSLDFRHHLYELAFYHKTFIRPFMEGGSWDSYKEFDDVLRMFIDVGYYGVGISFVPQPKQYRDCQDCPAAFTPDKFWSQSTWPHL